MSRFNDAVEMIDSQVFIPAEQLDGLKAAIGTYHFNNDFDDLDEALDIFDLVGDYDEDGNLVSLERDVRDESFAGDEMFRCFAPFVRAGDYMVFRQTFDDLTYKIAYDGAGGWKSLRATLAFDED